MTWIGAAKALFGRWGPLGLAVFVGYACTLVYILVLTPFAGAPDGGALPPLAVFILLAVGGAWRTGKISQLDARTRRAMRIYAVGLLMMAVTNALTDAIPHGTDFPSPPQYGRFAAALTLLVALHWFPLQTGGRPERLKLGIDGAVVLATGAMTIWYFVIAPELGGSGSAGTVVAGGVYPVVDLILASAAVRLQLRGAGSGIRRSVRLLTAALLILLLNDTIDAYHQAIDPGQSRNNPLSHALILTVFALLTLFPAELRHLGGNVPEPARRRAAGISRLPLAAVIFSCALMSFATIEEQGLSRLGVLILASTAVTLLVLFRQLLTQQENHAMATTDALTGVANRGRIDEILARTLEIAARNGRSTAVLLADLNGFKAVNDTLGHKAGDALLIQFADLLRRSVLGADLIGRLGGDEFVVILHGDHDEDDAQAVVRRITDAMTEPLLVDGSMIPPSASLGVAVSGPGELRPEELLHRADMAMYDNKMAQHRGALADEQGRTGKGPHPLTAARPRNLGSPAVG